TGPGNITVETDQIVKPQPRMVATIDDVKNHTGLLIDTREANRFAGRRENLDLKAGHIPGAVNVPERDLHHPHRTWQAKEEISQLVRHAGIAVDQLKDACVYSGAGNHSALALAAMEWIGLTGVRHYVGGWSPWSASPASPVERGDRTAINV